MGACASRPRDLDGEAPVELPAAKEVNTTEVTPAEANATTEAAAESSESKVEEEPLVDLSEPKSEERISEPKVEEQKNATPGETEGEPKEEAAEEVAAKSEEKAPEAAEPKQA